MQGAASAAGPEVHFIGGRVAVGGIAHPSGLHPGQAAAFPLVRVPVHGFPAVFAGAMVLRIVGVSPESDQGVVALSYVATLVTAAIPTALAALALLWVCIRLGASAGGASFAALVFGIGTPMWAYATLLWGHALAGACLMGAFAAAVALAHGENHRRDLVLGLCVGLLCGWATITEYPAAPPAALLAVLALVHAFSRRRAMHVGGAVFAGALVCATILAAYNQAAFGHPLSLSYTSVEGFSGMKAGFLGVTYPKASVAAELLLGRFRGLLPLAPVLALAPVGLMALSRRAGRASASVAIVIVAYYLAFNSAYVYWNGGWSVGPRHLAPALPFLCLGLAPLWSRGPKTRAALCALALVGAGQALVAVSTTPQPPESVSSPMATLLLPAFRDGDLALSHQSFSEAGTDPSRLRGGTLGHDAWNLGELLGLSGLASLVPLLLGWALAVILWLRFKPLPARSTGQPSRPAS